ncbi:unnamed protein product [Lymnaea stagnalis]|uniref:Uncharacterized protein n=1 Tax=Lymnaea stagnalis TaxID=6523 RepID=A0AAV2HQI7_LYMST
MGSVDLKKMCLAWFKRQPESNSNATVNLNNIVTKIEGDVRWTATVPVTQAQRGPVRKATVKFNRRMEDILAELEISKESETVADVTLTDGVVKGLGEKSITLRRPPGVGKAFASGITVKPGQNRTVSKKSDPASPRTSECNPPVRANGATATATITSRESSYKGRFEITVSLDGDVIFLPGDQQNIGEIIRELPKIERDPFFILDGKACLIVTGEVELRWDEPDTIQWSSSP